MAASTLVPGILTAVGGGVGVAAAVLAARAFGNARLLAESEPTPIGDLDEGLHELAGHLRAEGTLTSPQSGRACIYFRLLLEQRRRNRWETVLDQREGLDVLLDDGTGSVPLALTDADVVVSTADRVRTGILPAPSSELSALLARVAPLELPPAGPFLRWREEILQQGDRVFAVGAAARNGESWDIAGIEAAPLLVSDREEAEVIRHQRHAGQRWAAIGLVALATALYGGFGLLPSL